jgi:hypothetical protein
MASNAEWQKLTLFRADCLSICPISRGHIDLRDILQFRAMFAKVVLVSGGSGAE